MRDPVHAVAIGDSQSEGIGDPLDLRARRHGGFVNRLMDAWQAEPGADFAVTNLAVAGARMQDLVDEQLAPAIAARPDLLFATAGVNDARKNTPADELADAYDGILTAGLGSGATVVTSRLPDLVSHVTLLSQPKKDELSRRLRHVRATMDDVVDRHAEAMAEGRLLVLDLDGAVITRGMFSIDQLHLNGAGHAGYAQRVADLLADGGWRRVEVPTPRHGAAQSAAHLGWLARRYGPRLAANLLRPMAERRAPDSQPPAPDG